MNISELATIPNRLQDLENTVADMANRLHEVEQQPLAEDDDESQDDVCDIASVYAENEQLLIANQILHTKVAALREQIAETEEEYDSEVPEEDVNLDLVKQLAEFSSENQRLQDLCEERDEQLAAYIKRERQYVAMLKLASVCGA
jgi:hypothetical protein